VLVSVLVHSRRSKQRRRSEQRQSCRDFQPLDHYDYYANDHFDFSFVHYTPGYFYSYKHRDSNKTKGPKILVMLDVYYASYILFDSNNAYSFGSVA
jgi:hypothetical protein